jgi:pimeloyl-ACP methyl ester carboxylesterase
VWRLILDAPREPPSLIPIASSDYLRAGIARAARTLRYALADRVEEKLPLVRAPMLVVRGGRDPIVPQHWVEEATRLLPAARLEVIAQSAHAVNYDAPEELVRVMLPFLMNVENDSYCSGSANTKIKVSDII